MGCDAAARQARVVTTKVDGVQIATLENLPSLLDPEYLWTIQVRRQLRTQSESLAAEPLVYDPCGIVPLRDGRILVLDPLAERPLVLIDMDRPAVVGRFGRRGEGPGELGGYLTAWEDARGSLWVMDGTNRRVQHYSPDGTLLSSEGIDRRGLLLGRIVRAGADKIHVERFVPDPGRQTVAEITRLAVETGDLHPIVTLPVDPPVPSIQQGRPLGAALQPGIIIARSDIPSFRFYLVQRATHPRDQAAPLEEKPDGDGSPADIAEAGRACWVCQVLRSRTDRDHQCALRIRRQHFRNVPVLLVASGGGSGAAAGPHHLAAGLGYRRLLGRRATAT